MLVEHAGERRRAWERGRSGYDAPQAYEDVDLEPDRMLDWSTISDEMLLTRTGAGDRDAFLELYDRYAPRLLGLIIGLIRDRHASEDVLQRVMLEVWRRHAARYDPALGTVGAWLFRLTRSRAIDEQRSSRRKRPTPDEHLEAAVDDRTLADRPAESRDDAIRVRDAIARLQEDERLPIELAYVHGMSREQIAAQCNVPVGTIKTRIRRGLIKLRESLDDPWTQTSPRSLNVGARA